MDVFLDADTVVTRTVRDGKSKPRSVASGKSKKGARNRYSDFQSIFQESLGLGGSLFADTLPDGDDDDDVDGDGASEGAPHALLCSGTGGHFRVVYGLMHGLLTLTCLRCRGAGGGVGVEGTRHVSHFPVIAEDDARANLAAISQFARNYMPVSAAAAWSTICNAARHVPWTSLPTIARAGVVHGARDPLCQRDRHEQLAATASRVGGSELLRVRCAAGPAAVVLRASAPEAEGGPRGCSRRRQA
jgi:hypothetical protein